MKTNLLTSKEAKKGMEIFYIQCWNHHFYQERKAVFSRDTKGNPVYTPYDKDIYRITKATIHSCGGKLLRYIDDEGNMSGTEHKVRDYSDPKYLRVEGTYGWFVKSYEEAIAFVKEVFDSDIYRSWDFEIIYSAHFTQVKIEIEAEKLNVKLKDDAEKALADEANEII